MHDWRKVVLSQSDTIKTAIKVLDSEELRIIMIVDSCNRITGTVTDGDIRRGLIRHVALESKISKIMCKNPTVAFIDDKKEMILSKMRRLDLLQIPIVDRDNKITGLETLQHILKKYIYDNPVFLMAGGRGKRLRPLTNHTPKPLLKVGSKAILESIIEQFISKGFHKFYISIHYKAEMVREYFGDGSNWGVTINYINEENPLGTAGSLGLLKKESIKIPILMMNGDLLTQVDFEQLLNFHIKEKGDVTMCVREYDFKIPYGVIKANGNNIVSIKEKPIQKFFVNVGIYVLNPSMLDLVDGNSYIDMPQLLEDKIEKSGQVKMFPIHEYWLDIGQIEHFNQAQKDSDLLFK